VSCEVENGMRALFYATFIMLGFIHTTFTFHVECINESPKRRLSKDWIVFTGTMYAAPACSYNALTIAMLFVRAPLEVWACPHRGNKF
jgi:hypothetical protein